MSSKDRRQHLRLALEVNVNFSSEHNFYTGKTRDISMGGLFIEADVGLQVGAQIEIELHLLKRTFAVPAEVVWVLVDDDGNNQGVGVRFLSLPPEVLERIEAFMVLREPMDFEMESDGDKAPDSK